MRKKHVTNDKVINAKVVGNIQPSYIAQKNVQVVKIYTTNTAPNNQVTYYQNKQQKNPQKTQKHNDQERLQQ